MDQKDIDARVREAWQAHYGGQNDRAIEQFSSILDEIPDHIDANWGLGLAYRKLGDKEKARAAFERVTGLVERALESGPDDRERLFMLQRMARQQIEQIADFL